MRRIFGAPKKKEPPPTLEQAGSNLDARGTRIDEQIKKLDQQLMQFREQIKKTRPGPAQEALKRRALTILRQKRMYENQRETLYNQQFNMEQTRFTVESIQDTVQTVQALKGASSQMRVAMKQNKELDLNFIDNLQDELADMAELSNEINQMMGQSCYAVPDDVDEEELMGELDALEEDLAAEPGMGSGPSYLQEPDLSDLPAAPQQEAEEELNLPAAPAMKT